MKLIPWLAALSIAAALPAQAQHAGHDMPAKAEPTAWTDLPLVSARTRGPGGTEVRVVNSAAREVVVSPPKGELRTLELANGRAEVKPEIGNYHLLSALDSCDTHAATASTAVYFANPGPAPTTLLRQTRDGLTVTPERLPREHGAWRAGDTARFVVTMDGNPFPGAKVRFETSNGTKTELSAQPDGSVEIRFPEDFAPRDQRPPEAHGRPTQAQFVVAAIDNSSGVHRLGAFNYTYRPNAYDGMSLWTGAGFAALGMISAAPLLRRRDKGGRA